MKVGNEADGVAKVGDDLKLRHDALPCSRWLCQAQLQRSKHVNEE